MKEYQFFVIVGFLTAILREYQEGIVGNIFGVCSGLIIGIGFYLWLTDNSKSE